MYNFLKIDQCGKKILNDRDINIEPCPDQVRGKLVDGVYEDKEIKCKTNFVDYELYKENQLLAKLGNKKLESAIAIILESPHKHEFKILKNGEFEALGPAQCSTGLQFADKFQKLLNKSNIYRNIKKGVHPIIILNAIQFQCSLGKDLNYKNKKERDENWIVCFESECLNDLKLRLRALQPCAIINLCTKSLKNLQDILDKYVTEHIKEQESNVAYATGYHPSSWRNPKYAKINNILEV